MTTKNFLTPPYILWSTDLSPLSEGVLSTNNVVTPGGASTLQSISGLLANMVQIYSETFVSDLFGVFFYPQNSAMGALCLVPLFLVMGIIIAILCLKQKIQFTDQEKNRIFLLTLMAFSVFIAYVIKINSLNTSVGVFPDIRYLSPFYIPLTILGLLLLKKTQLLSVTPIVALRRMAFFWILAIPVSLVFVYRFYPEYQTPSTTLIPFDSLFALIILAVCVVTITVIVMQLFSKITIGISDYLIPILCALPLVWQIDIVLWVRTTISGAGYIFWIPIVRIIHEYILSPLFIS